jgi:hypothetical protein
MDVAMPGYVLAWIGITIAWVEILLLVAVAV